MIFVGKSSLLSNFKKEIKAYGSNPDSGKYEYYSFDGFLSAIKKNNPPVCRNNLLIVDEAHNLRNPASKKTKTIVDCHDSSKTAVTLPHPS